MIRSLACAALAAFVGTTTAEAQERQFLGHGRLITNDSLGEFKDRWQTGSVSVSAVRGPAWDGFSPTTPGALLEFRLGAQLISPAKLRDPDPDDRRYAGALSFGLHTHFTQGAADVAIGADLVVTGPQTRLGELQTGFHDAIDIVNAKPSVLDDQIGDGVHPTLVAEVGRGLTFGNRTFLRPFAEARWGAETLLRAGADLTIGTAGLGELLVRDPVSGQRYRVVTDPRPGLSLVFGGDVAAVDDSVFLPDDGGATLSDTRTRLRAGLHWQGERSAGFYGLTWLSEEFDEQPEGQIVGSLRLQLRF